MELKRKILSTIFFLSFYAATAQLIMVDSETGAYKYEDVVQVEGISKQQIIERAKEWINLYYKGLDVAIDSGGTIKTVASYDLTWKFITKNISLTLFYDIEIKTKDNRYKYSFYNFRVGKLVLGTIDAIDLKKYIERFPTKSQINIEEPVDTELTKAIESLENYIKNKEFKQVDDDW